MKPAAPTVAFAVRTVKGERRRIRSFLKQVGDLGVKIDDLPPHSVRALDEAEKFLGRYLDILGRETPSAVQLEGVIEALGGIDRVVKNAMAEILKSLGWRPEEDTRDAFGAAIAPAKPGRPGGAAGGRLLQFPGPRWRGRRS